MFTIYGHGGHLGHVTCTIYINFPPPFPINLALIGKLVSEKIFENHGYIHIYSPWTGTDNTLRSIFSFKL